MTNRNLFLIISFLFLFLNLGCSSLQSNIDENNQVFREYVFIGNYEKVWKACEKALGNYTLSNNSIDSGIIQTDWVRGDHVWTAPDSTKSPSSGMRERIIVYLTKGRTQRNSSVRVQIKKELELRKDFILEAEALKSDGLEEIVILYRIERELEIDKELAQAANKVKK